MKLQAIHEVKTTGGAQVRRLIMLHEMVKERVKPDATQEDIIKLVAYLEGYTMNDSFMLKDFMWINYEGMKGLKGNPMEAEKALQDFVDDDDLERSTLRIVQDDAKRFFSGKY